MNVRYRVELSQASGERRGWSAEQVSPRTSS